MLFFYHFQLVHREGTGQVACPSGNDSILSSGGRKELKNIFAKNLLKNFLTARLRVVDYAVEAAGDESCFEGLADFPKSVFHTTEEAGMVGHLNVTSQARLSSEFFTRAAADRKSVV